MRPRTLLFALALAAPCALSSWPFSEPAVAQAAVSVEMSLGDLVATSRAIVVATPLDRTSVWEDLGGSKRIVTYTRVRVERGVDCRSEAGAPAGCDAELMVRTLGGAVGKIGQYVAGEAQLQLGATSLLFLADAGGALVVTGMAQGQFPVKSVDGADVLAASPDLATILPRRGPSVGARGDLVGQRLERAIEAVLSTRKALDAKK